MKQRLCLFFLIAVIYASFMQAQSLCFFETFTDAAILQREIAHPIWGWAKPRAKVEVRFRDKVYSTKADAEGRWKLLLDPQKAGGPYELLASSGQETQRLEDVYFGDVFLLSGQSNMEWQLQQSDPEGKRAAAMADPLIRELTVAKSTADRPDEHLSLAAPWRAGTADRIANFSAVGSYFAHYLRKEVKVPIGLLHSSWGGSRIEPWMSAAALGLDPAAESIADQIREQQTEQALQRYRADFGPQAQPPKEDRGEALGYLSTETDYSRWPRMEMPAHWESLGYTAVDGVFYFVRLLDLSNEQAAQSASLMLGAIDDSDWTYVNGQLVGETYNQYKASRTYQVPARLLQPGRNVILVRVEDTGGGGGFSAAASSVKLRTAKGDISLAGDWHYQVGSMQLSTNYNQLPCLLYNKMIHPLAGMPLKGVLWYQGESNAEGEDARNYAELFPAMIKQWRAHFGQPDLPFYWVQLANYLAPQTTPDEEGWAVLRNSQTAALKLPHTGQAVITDIGEADDIHPQNKWEVGRRLSLHALKNLYGKTNLSAASPSIAGKSRQGDAVLLRFKDVGTGLLLKKGSGSQANGFVYQNQQGDWQWAKATVGKDAKSISVYPVGKDRIMAIRYAWANNPTAANVFSKEGLPLTPFHLNVE